MMCAAAVAEERAGGGGNGTAGRGGSYNSLPTGVGQQQQQVVAVPPGFRFHPTDEELLYYYLRKKVAYEVIDLDVIRDVDLNKLEPWDLKEKCRIGTGPQNEWYFFSHKDKKYPTGTRTNRATNAGFWKATGRDKAIHHLSSNSNNSNNNKPIGMRKTLVFYTGRAPHGQKTNWIMHEYRLIDDHFAQNVTNNSTSSDHHQHHHHHHHQVIQQADQDGWVVCRVFKKKNHQRGFQHEVGDSDHHHQQAADHHHHQLVHFSNHMMNNTMKGTATGGGGGSDGSIHHHPQQQQPHHQYHDFSTTLFDSSMHLPQLLSPESQSAVAVPASLFLQQPNSLNNLDIECSQNLMKLTSSSSNTTSTGGNGGGGIINNIIHHYNHQQDHNSSRFNGTGSSDWSFLDKLLASNHHIPAPPTQVLDLCPPATNSLQKFPFQYHGCETDHIMKFSM